MRSDELDRAIGPTPPSFAQRMDQALLGLKEENNVKRTAFRTVLVAALMVALLGSTAYALIHHGLEWYYSNRFTAYQEHEPDRHEAIISHVQTQVPQQQTADPDVVLRVTEASLAAEQKVLVVALEARAVDAEVTVLHPMDHLDADGSYVGKGNLALYPDDEEARDEHWLWTEAGFGPVAEMVAPGKQLLLLDAHEVLLNDLPLLGDGSAYDSYVTDDGGVHIVIEIRLDHLAPAFFQQQALELTIPYSVTPYTEDDASFYTCGREGKVTFTLDMQ